MRAFLAVGDVSIFIGPNQDARVVLCRIAEEPDAANGDIVGTANSFLGINRCFAEPGTNENLGISGKHSQARQHEKFRELSPAHVAFVGGVNGKLVFPERLAAGRSE